MTQALVLNASFEPLSVVSDRRATVLVITGKAETVSGTGKLLRSEHLVVDVPSVVRLRRYVRVPFRRRAALNRRAVFARDRGRCQYCGSAAESIDHVIPRARGGSHTWDNVVAACQSCNHRKRDRLLADTSMRLATAPRAPRGHGWVMAAVGRVPIDWMPYLDLDSVKTA